LDAVNFEFATPTRVIFGADKLREAGKLAGELGQCAFVVTGKTMERAAPLLRQLENPIVFPVAGEPTFDTVRAGADAARQAGCDLVIGFGGGSAMDAAKVIAALLANGGDPLDYVEIIGAGKPLNLPPLPCIAIPTTAGTGAEVTRNAVLGSPQHRVKISMRSPALAPRIALVDPDIVHASVACRFDALTQLIEAFVSKKANPLTDAICREGMRRWREGGNQNWALAALLSGMALANAGLGAAHGFAGPIGGMFDAPHGAVCAALLPSVMRTNARLAPNPERFDEVRRLAGDVAELCGALGVKPLRHYGVRQEDFPVIIEKAAASSSMKNNPVALTMEQMLEILQGAW
jgi:alcohol dehydrogenase class IV